MPRRLLRNGRIVEDEWLYLAEAASNATAPLIVTLSEWQSQSDSWLARASPLGIVLSAAQKIEQLLPDLARFALIAAEFSGPGEGRGYTLARLLRERWNFTGEVRAIGVRRDQVFFLARCGFDSFELPEADMPGARADFSTFSAAYQPSNDRGLRLKLPRHIPASV